MEETLRTRSEAGDDGEPQEVLEVPDWFRDLQASQPERYVEEAFRLGVGENGSVPAWLASVQGMQTSAEPPEGAAEPLQAEADFMQVDGDSVQAEANTRQVATESQQAEAEPLPAAREPLPATAQPAQAPAQPAQAETEPLPADTEPLQHAPRDRTVGEASPRWLRESRATEPETRTAHASEEGYDAEIQSAGWLVEPQTAEGAGEPKVLAREGDNAEDALELPGDPHPAAEEPREDGTHTRSESSDRLLTLLLRALRERKREPIDGVVAVERSSAAGEWLGDLVDSLPVQASVVQGQGAALPERETANPDRFASRARVFSEIVTHPPQVAPAVTAQPKSGSRSRSARYVLYAVLIVIVLGAILAIAFGTRSSQLVGWIQSILENLGGLIGG
jgi:hypothetical protein